MPLILPPGTRRAVVDRDAKVEALLARHPEGLRTADVRVALGITQPQAYHACTRLVRAGRALLVRTIERGHPVDRYLVHAGAHAAGPEGTLGAAVVALLEPPGAPARSLSREQLRALLPGVPSRALRAELRSLVTRGVLELVTVADPFVGRASLYRVRGGVRYAPPPAATVRARVPGCSDPHCRCPLRESDFITRDGALVRVVCRRQVDGRAAALAGCN